MVRKALLGLILLLCSPIDRLQGDDCYSEYWQQFFWNMWENDKFALGTYVKLETGNHFKKIRYFQINEQFAWKKSENFSLEIHYAYVHSRSIVPYSLWRWQHRLELEANPVFHLPCNCLLQTRNRLEIRRVQAEPKIRYELRQMTMLVVPLKKGALKAFSIYNELFYNASTHYFNQDRVCPCRLTFAISDKVEFDVFFLIRFIYLDNIWRKSAVVGTEIDF